MIFQLQAQGGPDERRKTLPKEWTGPSPDQLPMAIRIEKGASSGPFGLSGVRVSATNQLELVFGQWPAGRGGISIKEVAGQLTWFFKTRAGREQFCDFVQLKLDRLGRRLNVKEPYQMPIQAREAVMRRLDGIRVREETGSWLTGTRHFASSPFGQALAHDLNRHGLFCLVTAPLRAIAYTFSPSARFGDYTASIGSLRAAVVAHELLHVASGNSFEPPDFDPFRLVTNTLLAPVRMAIEAGHWLFDSVESRQALSAPRALEEGLTALVNGEDRGYAAIVQPILLALEREAPAGRKAALNGLVRTWLNIAGDEEREWSEEFVQSAMERYGRP